MRSLTLVLMAGMFALLSACATRPAVNGSLANGVAAASSCPELEGYPDCQNGRHVDLASRATYR